MRAAEDRTPEGVRHIRQWFTARQWFTPRQWADHRQWRTALAVRVFQPATVVSIAIIAAVAAMVAVANWRDVRRSRLVATRPSTLGTRGARTGRVDLASRIAELRATVARRP